MGNCFSSGDSRRPQQQRIELGNIGQPQNVQIHVPRNRVDQHGVPIQPISREVDERTLRAALRHLSNFIAQRGRHISLIAVGGAVNILYLRSRNATHDVDVFSSDIGNQTRTLLDDAMYDAQSHIPGLGTDWINTETQMWMRGDMQHELTTAARAQNVKVYNEAGLTIYAAPWEYAFSAKMNRVADPRGQARPYDLDDAVVYIRQYIQAHGGRPIRVAGALNWARRYGHGWSQNFLLQRVNPEYRRRYGQNAFVQ